jgi:hypothetical protein
VHGQQVVQGVEVVLVPGPDNPHAFGVEDPAVIEWMLPRLSPHPWHCFIQPLRIADPEALAAIPQSHIVASPGLPEEHPERVAAARASGRLWFVETEHDLMLRARPGGCVAPRERLNRRRLPVRSSHPQAGALR